MLCASVPLIRCASGRAQVRFWDGATLQPVKAFRQDWTVESASFCPAKGRFAAGGEDMWVHLYDYATGEELECNKGAPARPLSP